MEDCRAARKEIRKNTKEEKCRKRIFGEGKIVREEYKKYSEFMDCMK